MPRSTQLVTPEKFKDSSAVDIVPSWSLAPVFYVGYVTVAYYVWHPQAARRLDKRVSTYDSALDPTGVNIPTPHPKETYTERVRSALAGPLSMVLQYSAEDLGVETSGSLPRSDYRMLARYTRLVMLKAHLEPTVHDLESRDPDIATLANPLSTSTAVAAIWNWRLDKAEYDLLPPLEEAIQKAA